jgi:hypothetical protein
MDATDRICRMLDEHGIAYETPSTTCTEAYINGIEYTFYEHVEPLDDSLEGKVFATTEWLTPEQVIAATVGEEHEMHICKRCGVAYELNIIDKGFGKPRFCPNCGYRRSIND